ncbi:MAG: hypothetical protein GXO88_02190 [Chlorobi bacterium]|nr:hypothetical protein [Chlorobiota bacterium]
MKKLITAFAIIISISVMFSACKKSSGDPLDPSPAYKGSFNVNINGISYSTLKSDVYEMDEGVTFYADDKKGGQFQIAIPNIPAVGETATLDLEAPENATMVLVALGPIDGYSTLVAGSGTVKRESADKYTLANITLFGGNGFTDEFPMSGTVTVGAYGNR